MRLFSFFLLLVSINLTSCKSTKGSVTDTSPQAKGVQFSEYATLSDALDDAAAQNKIVFVDFYTTWCLPCRMMDEDVFSDKKIGEFMNTNFINYKVDAEKGTGPNLALIYNVQAYPTLFFLDAKGNVLETKVGATYHTELKRMGKRALASQQQ